LIASNLYSQNSFGTISSNYAPTNSVNINPSSMANSKTYLDINIVGAGVYANNNLFLIPVNNWIGMLTGDQKIDFKKDVFYDKQTLNLNRDVNLFVRGFVAGPGATWNKGDHAVGLAFNGRSYTAIQNMPAFIGGFLEKGFKGFTRQQGKLYDVNNMKFASINFAEIKLSYANTFYRKDKNLLAGGISIKKFYAISGAATNISDLSFNVLNDSVFSVPKLDIDRMSSGLGVNKSGGMGFDIGFTYQRMLSQCDSYLSHTAKSNCRIIPYKYKVGLSLIDIGSVKFDETKMTYGGYNYKDLTFLGDVDQTLTNYDSTLNIFSNQDDLTTGKVTKKNSIQLPSFFSAQFDYNVWASAFYVNATIVQGLPRSATRFGIQHASSLSITPRFETRFFEFALPFSLYGYKVPQLGMNLKLGPLTIGSDKFINWLINSDIYGGDIYVFFKAPITFHSKCREMVLHKRKAGGSFRSKIDSAF